jgi:hypothetical protein
VLTEQESEILGIMFGDGSLSRTERSVQIAITGNKFDDEVYLLEHVRPLFQGVFDLELTSRYRHGENTMDLYRYSKEVALTLHSWGMPIGLKKLENLTPKVAVAGERSSGACSIRMALSTASMDLMLRSSSRQFPRI